MNDELPQNLFVLLRIDKQALNHLQFCWDQMKDITDPQTAPFFRQSFARAVFSYFIVARNLLWADIQMLHPKADNIPQKIDAVFSSFLAVFHQHDAVGGRTVTVILSDDENQLLKETEERLGKLIFPTTSLDLTVSAEETDRLARAIWVLDRVVRD